MDFENTEDAEGFVAEAVDGECVIAFLTFEVVGVALVRGTCGGNQLWASMWICRSVSLEDWRT